MLAGDAPGCGRHREAAPSPRPVFGAVWVWSQLLGWRFEQRPSPGGAGLHEGMRPRASGAGQAEALVEASGVRGLGEELGRGRGTPGLRVTAVGLCGVSEGCHITAVGRRTRVLARGALRPSAGCPRSPFSQGCFVLWRLHSGPCDSVGSGACVSWMGSAGRWSSEHSPWAALVLRLRPALRPPSCVTGWSGPWGVPSSVLLLQVWTKGTHCRCLETGPESSSSDAGPGHSLVTAV